VRERRAGREAPVGLDHHPMPDERDGRETHRKRVREPPGRRRSLPVEDPRRSEDGREDAGQHEHVRPPETAKFQRAVDLDWQTARVVDTETELIRQLVRRAPHEARVPRAHSPARCVTRACCSGTDRRSRASAAIHAAPAPENLHADYKCTPGDNGYESLFVSMGKAEHGESSNRKAGLLRQIGAALHGERGVLGFSWGPPVECTASGAATLALTHRRPPLRRAGTSDAPRRP
jgi:hypothetical protein